MRRYYLLFCFLVLSCTKSEIEISIGIREKTYQTQTGPTEAVSNVVSMSDILELIGGESPKSKSNADLQYDISAYIGKELDTLMFILNSKNGGGWRILSSDKRTPAVLAEGSEGYFSLEDGSPAVAVWMSYMADDIARVRHSSDDELTFSEDEIRANKAFWSVETPRYDPVTDYPPGHWEETVYSQTIACDSLIHMVPKWHQYSPYNNCCPYYVSTPSDRAIAGCVAVAGSQILYYLHYKIGLPASMYSEGYCIGDIDNNYCSFTNPTSAVWSTMVTYCRPESSTVVPESILIGHIGRRVNMHYCDNVFGQYSWALGANLKPDVFEHYGISCYRDNYDADIVKTSLENEMPVIVSATDLLVPADFDFHTFVIDGYLKTQKVYTHHHYYVLDEVQTTPYIVPDDYTTYSYSTPTITSIRINWGWKSQWHATAPVNDGWYTLTDGWTVTNGGTYNYNHHRKMTYGFSVTN